MQIKWLQKWILVPYVIRHYQYGEVTQYLLPIAVQNCCVVLAKYELVPYWLNLFIQQHCYQQWYKRLRNRSRMAE